MPTVIVSKGRKELAWIGMRLTREIEQITKISSLRINRKASPATQKRSSRVNDVVELIDWWEIIITWWMSLLTNLKPSITKMNRITLMMIVTKMQITRTKKSSMTILPLQNSFTISTASCLILHSRRFLMSWLLILEDLHRFQHKAGLFMTAASSVYSKAS